VNERRSFPAGLFAVLVTFLAVGLVRADSDAEVAMVTLLQGNVVRVATSGRQPVEAFTKLKHGDLLILDGGSRLQVVYFDNGRQERWRGGGRLEIAKSGGISTDLPSAEIKVLPPVLVKQIAKTPALESQGRAGMMRLRAFGTAEDIAKVEDTYKRMRNEAARDDLNPELYYLSSMFEMRELARVEQVIATLQKDQAGNPDVGVVVALYSRAVKNARESRAR
jgi:hypothetical protein